MGNRRRVALPISGSYGLSSGATIAATASRTSVLTASMPARLCKKRVRTSARYERGATAPVSAVEGTAAGSWTMVIIGGSFCSSPAATRSGGLAQPWVDQQLQHIHQQVHEHECHGHDQHAGLQHLEVAGRDRLEDQLPQARPREDRLHEYGATEQEADLEARDREYRRCRHLGDGHQHLPATQPP